MAEKAITKQQQDALELGRNSVPVPECSVHTTTIKGQSCQALDVPVLGCAGVWLRVQKEAEAWIAPGGKLIEDSLARNRRINQAYAQLWKEDKRFQWAGLAAFAPKQVGCGLLHAADNIKKSMEEIQQNVNRNDVRNSSEAAAVSLVPSAISASSAYLYGQLALGNTLLFLDIYPIHRFHMLRGLAQLKQCIGRRADIAEEIIWPVKKAKLPCGVAYPEIIKAFEFIEAGRIDQSVKTLAQHEQLNILQAAIYNDALMRTALSANQFAWATDFPTGTAAEIRLTLSSECRSVSPSSSIWFSKKKSARLYNQSERMEFVNRAADQFHSLLNSSARSSLEASLDKIASGGAIK